ncbi:MAG: hypothetical protein P8J93_02650 [SAR86 cluster bacterium]|nr:hypothetical protein [SAR86 cluster bacterium]
MSTMINEEKTKENLEEVIKGLNLLSRERKVVLSHHKAFDLVDDLKNRMNEIKQSLNQT